MSKVRYALYAILEFGKMYVLRDGRRASFVKRIDIEPEDDKENGPEWTNRPKTEYLFVVEGENSVRSYTCDYKNDVFVLPGESHEMDIVDFYVDLRNPEIDTDKIESLAKSYSDNPEIQKAYIAGCLTPKQIGSRGYKIGDMYEGFRITDETIDGKDLKVGDVIVEGYLGWEPKFRTITELYGTREAEYFDGGYYKSVKYEYCHWVVRGQAYCDGKLIRLIDRKS